jgi:predicted nuclease with TOPRIM domain
MKAEFESSTAASRGSIQDEQRDPLRIEVSAGELLDKLTILRIKSDRIADSHKLQHVRTELEVLTAVRHERLSISPELDRLETELETINLALWDIESGLRQCEANSDFGPHFVQLARSVYKLNDRRSELKRAVNQLVHSRIIEEKSY